MSARNRELLALVPAALLVIAGFAAVFIQRQHALSNVSLVYGGVFFGLCLVVHLIVRVTVRHADPYLFPLVAVLACFGLVILYRINQKLAGQQAAWFVVGLVFFAGTIIWLRRDYRRLERYRYTIAAASIALLVLPRLPGIGAQVNGAYLAIRLGPILFQPVEFAKVGIVVFLASYLRDTRQLMVVGARRILGITFPPLKYFGPVLVVWGLAMVLLVVLHDLGTSLMFFAAFLAMLYVATNRASFVAVGTAVFVGGAWYFGTHVAHVQDRIQTWLHPFQPRLYNKVGGSYQIAQSLFAQADGGLFGRGFGQALITQPNGQPLVPVPESDLIYAVITNELGLFGAVAVIVIFLLITARGMKIAVAAPDSFSTLLATGLTFVLAVQVFVIVGGVTKTIPFTGVTLPFISYGGSSIVANFVLIALLLLISDRTQRAGRER